MIKFLVILCSSLHLCANIGPQGFAPFLNKYFVETGTYGGSGIQHALNAGFKEIRSIDIDMGHYLFSSERFRDRKNVKLMRGDSSRDLYQLIQDIDAPATFWLDAHIYPVRTDGGKNCPLIEELEQIRQHPIKTHTILIDDLHCCDSEAFDHLSREDIIRKLLEINPNYKISYVPGGDEGEYPENVMVAKVNAS